MKKIEWKDLAPERKDMIRAKAREDQETIIEKCRSSALQAGRGDMDWECFVYWMRKYLKQVCTDVHFLSEVNTMLQDRAIPPDARS